MYKKLHKRALLIAHRGDTISFPENTVEAFISAFEKGADGIELDIQLKDGEIIIVHDYLHNRNQVYPKLEDVLEKIHLKGRVEIEIKAFSVDILRPLGKVLDEFLGTDFELTTSEIPLACYVKDAFPHIPMGLIFHDFLFERWMSQEIVKRKLIGWGRMTKADVLHIPFKILNLFGREKLINELHEVDLFDP
ncbi:glycerophosphodiester phosphodiesterase, partial [Patescibacteria group bacterium]|nr:glycerophosphodiester phosphodiesterase [Patescibacteria group bacterium]